VRKATLNFERAKKKKKGEGKEMSFGQPKGTGLCCWEKVLESRWKGRERSFGQARTAKSKGENEQD